MSTRQWAEWQLYAKHFPLPHLRADINTALIRHSSLSPYMKGKFDATKLMPRYGVQKKRQTDEEIKSVMQSWRTEMQKAAGQCQPSAK